MENAKTLVEAEFQVAIPTHNLVYDLMIIIMNHLKCCYKSPQAPRVSYLETLPMSSQVLLLIIYILI